MDGADVTARPESEREKSAEVEGADPVRAPDECGPVGARTDGDAGSEAAPTDAADPDPAPASLVVHVAGAVVFPGVARVPSGSRAGDALDAAGNGNRRGSRRGEPGGSVAGRNDGGGALGPGETVGQPPPNAGPVPGAGAGNSQGAGGTGGTEGSGSSGALLNMNSASLQELGSLPRVGPVIAQRINDWCEEHGSFSRPFRALMKP